MYLPKYVAYTQRIIKEGTSIAPQVVRISDNRYRLTIANDRIFCTVDIKFTGNRWVWAGSQLVVDGVRRQKLMESPEAFFRLFHDPDSDGLQKADLANIPEYPEVKDLDPALQKMLEIAKAKLETSAPEVQHPQLRVVQHRSRAILETKLSNGIMRWDINGERLILLIMDGWDLTDRFDSGATLTAILAYLTNGHAIRSTTPDGSGPVTHGTPNSKTTANSVRVRNQAVIRT
jgi:hypothetical protein